MEDGQAVHVAVLEVFQRLTEQHVAGGAAAVEEEEAAARLSVQDGFQHGEDGGDAGAGGEGDVQAPNVGTSGVGADGGAEAADGGHDLERHAGFQGVHGPGGEDAAFQTADGDAEFAVVLA